MGRITNKLSNLPKTDNTMFTRVTRANMRKHIAPSQGLDSGPWHIHQQTSRLSTVRPDSPTLICKGPNPEIKNQQNVCEKEITGTVEDRNLKDPDDVYEEPIDKIDEMNEKKPANIIETFMQHNKQDMKP